MIKLMGLEYIITKTEPSMKVFGIMMSIMEMGLKHGLMVNSMRVNMFKERKKE